MIHTADAVVTETETSTPKTTDKALQRFFKRIPSPLINLLYIIIL